MNNNFLTSLHLEKRIGSGHFGDVWEGQDPIHGRVAVKIFRKMDDELPENWLQRKSDLLTEGQRLKDAEHEHVVRVFHIAEAHEQDSVYLIMEYCGGGCLMDHYRQGPMQISTLRDVLMDAAFGLQAVHMRGMIHRDIKPSNILLDSANHAKIADFGLVTNRLVLGYASGMGYNDHLAPEVFNALATSVRSDVWAFGMTVYRLLHGEKFYSQYPRPSESVWKGQFARKLIWLPHIPDSWRRFVRKCMADDPDQRFQNATELLSGIERLTIKPNWKCEYSLDETTWHLVAKERKIEVRLKKATARQYVWDAMSLPLTDGQNRKLGGSAGIVGKTDATNGLREFLNRLR